MGVHHLVPYGKTRLFNRKDGVEIIRSMSGPLLSITNRIDWHFLLSDPVEKLLLIEPDVAPDLVVGNGPLIHILPDSLLSYIE